MSGPGDLYAAAAELMAATVVALDTTPDGAPPTQAIWPGVPAFDCVPALYVHAGGTQIGDTLALTPALQPMQRMVTSGEVNLAQFTVTVLRCVPMLEQVGQTVRLPPADAIEAAARQIYADLWACWNTWKQLHQAGTLFQRPSGRREFAFDPALPIQTSGGAGGWEIPVRVEVGGY